MHQPMAATLDRVHRAHPADPARCPQPGRHQRAPRWPMIVLRSPKGWTGPKVVDGQPVEGTFRAHQVPLSESTREPRAPRASSRTWMRSYEPEELFDENGRLIPDLAELAPDGNRRMGANPHANGGICCADAAHARLPRLRRRAYPHPRPSMTGDAARPGQLPPRRDQAQPGPATTSASSVPTRPPPIASKPSSKSTNKRGRAEIGQRTTTTSPPTAA